MRVEQRWREAALVALLAVGASCADGGRAAKPLGGTEVARPSGPPAAARGPTILVAVDGVRWQEVFEGTDPALSGASVRPPSEYAPNLDRLARERGASIGAPARGVIAASGPNFVSLPGYTELLTGRPHGCADNACPTTTTPTILDEAHERGAKVAAFASWELLERATSSAPGSFLVSCGRHGDPTIDPSPGSGDYRPDRATAEAALAYLEAERPDVLFLGLGDPDEHAHRGNYAGYLDSISFADAVIGRIEAALSRMGERGARTSLVVTADHGRAIGFRDHGGSAPESARVWLVARGPIAAARGAVLSPRARHLADVAPTLRVVLGLPQDMSDGAGVVMSELLSPAQSAQPL